MMKYLEGGEISEDEIKAAIRKGTLSLKINPVFCGTSYRNKGVQKLLDAVIDYLPSPLDIPNVQGKSLGSDKTIERKTSDDEKFAGLAFKIMSDPFVGKLAFFRVYSGTLETGAVVLNSTKNKKNV